MITTNQNGNEIHEMLEIGRSYIDTSPHEALKYFRVAMDLGSVAAIFNIGKRHDVCGHKELAIKYYELADQCSVGEASYNLALLYYQEPLYKDIDKALNYFIRAFELGVNRSLFKLGYVYEHDLLNIEEAIKYYVLDCGIGHVVSMEQLGKIYSTLGDNLNSIKYYKMALDNGSNDVIEELADVYLQEELIAEAIDLYEKALERDISIYAMTSLGYIYTATDINKAISYYSMASNAGDIYSMFALGEIYENKKLISKAIIYYEMASNYGHPTAAEKLEALLPQLKEP
jgi:TPR repeat protein